MAKDVRPWRVGVVVDKQFTPYKAKFRYWSSANYTLPLAGLPDGFAAALRPHFRVAELLPVGRSGSSGQHDLIATMSVDQLHFDGANTTVGSDTVELTMTFAIGRSDGTEVFRRTLTTTKTASYNQRCAFCAPDPSEAFIAAFTAVFDALSEALTTADIQMPS